MFFKRLVIGLFAASFLNIGIFADTFNSIHGGFEMDPVVRRIYLSARAPSIKCRLADDGRFDTKSVQSYAVDSEISSCSFIARKNLENLLMAGGMTDIDIPQGDAMKLIRSGVQRHALTTFVNKASLLTTINIRKNQYVETVFDVYRYVPTRTPDMQGHRAVVFLGDDEQWYILDPLDGKKTTTPQLFQDYLDHDVHNAQWYARLPGYSLINPLDAAELATALPFLSPEIQLFFEPESLETLFAFSSSTNYLDLLASV